MKFTGQLEFSAIRKEVRSNAVVGIYIPRIPSPLRFIRPNVGTHRPSLLEFHQGSTSMKNLTFTISDLAMLTRHALHHGLEPPGLTSDGRLAWLASPSSSERIPLVPHPPRHPPPPLGGSLLPETPEPLALHVAAAAQLAAPFLAATNVLGVTTPQSASNTIPAGFIPHLFGRGSPCSPFSGSSDRFGTSPDLKLHMAKKSKEIVDGSTKGLGTQTLVATLIVTFGEGTSPAANGASNAHKPCCPLSAPSPPTERRSTEADDEAMEEKQPCDPLPAPVLRRCQQLEACARFQWFCDRCGQSVVLFANDTHCPSCNW